MTDITNELFLEIANLITETNDNQVSRQAIFKELIDIFDRNDCSVHGVYNMIIDEALRDALSDFYAIEEDNTADDRDEDLYWFVDDD